MPNYEIDPEFIQSQYLSGTDQTEFQLVAAVPEAAESGINTEPTINTNPVLIELVERPRRSKIYDDDFYFD